MTFLFLIQFLIFVDFNIIFKHFQLDFQQFICYNIPIIFLKEGIYMEINNKMYHIGLNAGDIENAKTALIAGDPARIEKIAEHFEKYKFLGFNREYKSYLAYEKNTPILIMSVGMGGPSAAIGIEEMAQIGIKNIIRIGTCGGMQKDVVAGDIVIANAAIRAEGTSLEYMPIEFPACADFELTCLLKNSAENLNFKYHIGTVHCKDSFYGQHEPSRMPVGKMLEYKWNAWKMGGALASEMETAALFVVSSVLGIKSAAILLCVWNQELEYNSTDFDTEKAVKVAVNAIKNI